MFGRRKEIQDDFFPVICFKLPITGTAVKGKLSSISLEGLSYGESTVDDCSHLCTHNNMLAPWRMLNQRQNTLPQEVSSISSAVIFRRSDLGAFCARRFFPRNRSTKVLHDTSLEKF